MKTYRQQSPVQPPRRYQQPWLPHLDTEDTHARKKTLRVEDSCDRLPKTRPTKALLIETVSVSISAAQFLSPPSPIDTELPPVNCLRGREKPTTTGRWWISAISTAETTDRCAHTSAHTNTHPHRHSTQCWLPRTRGRNNNERRDEEINKGSNSSGCPGPVGRGETKQDKKEKGTIQ